MRQKATGSRALTRGKNHITLDQRIRPWLFASSLCAGLALFAGGFWLGREQAAPQERLDRPMLTSVLHSVPEHRVTLESLGELAARLQSLESDTQALRQLLDDNNHLRAEVSAVDATLLPALLPGNVLADGSGGMLLPAIDCDSAGVLGQATSLSRLHDGQRSARCLRNTLDALMIEVANRNAALMAVPSRRPVEGGRLGSLFGNRVDPFNRRLAFHSGVDFALPRGAPVQAAAGGTVSAVGWLGGYGRRIEIDHGNGLTTRYAHLSSTQVSKGEVVTPGQRIGLVGSSGRSTGPHLHFEVIRDGQFLDPQRFLALGNLERDEHGDAHD